MTQKSMGNTEPLTSEPKPKRSRSWSIVINNYTEVDKYGLEAIDYQYLCYAPEVGESGTPHLQAYAYFKNPRTLKSLKNKLPRAHLEECKGNHEQNVTYIKGPYTKDDKHKPVNPQFKELGEPPSQGTRTDLKSFMKSIEEGKRGKELDIEMRAKYPKLESTLIKESLKDIAVKKYKDADFIEVHVRYGRPGVGKTRYVYDKHGVDNTYVVSMGDGSGKSLWFDGYDGQPVMLLDDFNGEIPFKFFLRLIDIYPIQLQIKGSSVWRACKYIYITSNKHPDHWYKGTEDDYNALMRRFTSITLVE